jgi:hypothetical protein
VGSARVSCGLAGRTRRAAPELFTGSFVRKVLNPCFRPEREEVNRMKALLRRWRYARSGGPLVACQMMFK